MMERFIYIGAIAASINLVRVSLKAKPSIKALRFAWGLWGSALTAMMTMNA